MPPAADPHATRRLVHLLLITLAVGSAAGRVLSTQRVFEPKMYFPPGTIDDPTSAKRVWPPKFEPAMPTFSSNDRSRWATVRALVDDGTYIVGHRDPALVGPESKFGDTGIVFEPGWGTVDKVLDPEKLVFYSSKPPLLSTMVAGEYWALKKSFGWTLKDRPHEVVRTVLMTINVLPLAVYLWLLARLLDRHGASDWASFFLVGTAAFGTLVTPFLITLNNHTIGTFSVLIALYAALRIWAGEDRAALHVLAGFCAGFAVTNELPAAAFATGLFVMLCWRSPRKTILWFVPAAVLPVVALMFTNYLAMGSWFDLAYSKFGGPWYEYEGSHWLNVKKPPPRHSIDWADNFEGKGMYALNLLVGHRGIFSLTPVFVLSLVGLGVGMCRSSFSRQRLRRARISRSVGTLARLNDGESCPRHCPRMLFAFTLLVSLIVVGYYIVKTVNYGGMSSGPRWLMWLTPLWLVTALPTAEWLGGARWGRVVALVLLGLSVLSASYPAWNPWTHPWIYNFFDAQGWVPY